GTIPATPVGSQTPSPITVIVVGSDGVTPVAGASVQFTSSPVIGFSACGGSTNCSVRSDESGVGLTFLTGLFAGAITGTAKLAPASYPSPQQVQTSLVGTSSQLDLSLLNPSVWIAQGASMSFPINARALSNGAPLPGKTVSYQITQGAAALSSSTAQSDSNGNASVNLQINSLSSPVQVKVCMAPGNGPCQNFNAGVVPVSQLQLRAISGTLQIVRAGQPFRPVSVRVTDSSTPSNPVMGASVLFVSY